MADVGIWSERLEIVAVAELTFSLLACVGPIPAYNVAIALAILYSAYARVGRMNAANLLIHLLSLVIDITVLSLHGSTWSDAKHEAAFGMAMIIINMFIKCVAVVVMFFIHGELGVAFPTGWGEPKSISPAAPYQHFQGDEEGHADLVHNTGDTYQSQ